MRILSYRTVLAAALPAILVVSAACGSGNNNASTSSSNTGSGGAPSKLATVTGDSSAAGAAVSTSLTEVTTDNKFSQTRFTVPAGQSVTLTLANKGSAVHNWHLSGQKDASGNDIKTPLLEAGKTATLTFTIAKAGTYNLLCDVHPSEMKGQLIVQ